MTGHTGGRYAADIDAHFHELRMQKEIRVSCMHCDWELEGIAGDVISLQRQHASRVHGVKRGTGKKVRHLKSPRSGGMTPEQEAQVYADIELRKRLHGIEV